MRLIRKITFLAAALFFCGCSLPAPFDSSTLISLTSAQPIESSLAESGSDEAHRAASQLDILHPQTADLTIFGFTETQAEALTARQQEVYTFCAAFLTDGWGHPPLAEDLYPAITGLPESAEVASGSLIPVVFSYGSSSQGRPLYAVSLTPDDWDRTIMLTFAIHGFEGLCEGDGGFLVRYACQIALFFSRNPDYLGTARLILIPMANPDGVLASTRKQAEGIDLNRDFAKDRFNAPESIALRDFIEQQKPEILIDFHGWDQECYGDEQLATVVEETLKIPHADTFAGRTQGYLAGYAAGLGIRSLLVEYAGVRKSNVPKTILAVSYLMQYGNFS